MRHTSLFRNFQNTQLLGTLINTRREKVTYRKCKKDEKIGTENLYGCKSSNAGKIILIQITMNALCLMILHYKILY